MLHELKPYNLDSPYEDEVELAKQGLELLMDHFKSGGIAAKTKIATADGREILNGRTILTNQFNRSSTFGYYVYEWVDGNDPIETETADRSIAIMEW
jgi:Ser/Thr protein kinase RdoA (MazF antagonist)